MPRGLVTAETIHVPTTEGPKQIELLFGDITQLAAADGVDMIMVSAFHGDYAPIRGTVIGALNLMGLSVRELAWNKAEDLRQLSFCWWSQPLPDKFPYRRLLCFETSRANCAPQTAVNDVFRALISASFLFPSSGGSIISPLLSTGNQGHSSSTMLRALVDAAANWMRCGLNVRTFKIVVYSPSDDLRSLFDALKRKWESKTIASADKSEKKEVLNNLYLCYHRGDATRVGQIKTAFHAKSPVIRMDEAGDIDTGQEEWMLPISTKMKSYRRVLVFLSPAFVNDETCVQLYNLALCTSRLMGPGFLSPFYLDTVAPIPTYMTMVQWIDARFVDKTPSANSAAPPVAAAKNGQHRSYDVFISYSHKDSAAAELILNELESGDDATSKAAMDRRLSVFYDRNDLHVGTSWQLTLYNAVQSARVVVALLSESYIQSAMCQEELALSVARHCAPGSSAHLVPVWLDDAAKSSALFSSGYVGRPIKACRAPRGVQDVMKQLCKTVRLLVDDGTANDDKPPIRLDVSALARSYRMRLFRELSKMFIADNADRRTRPTPSTAAGADQSGSKPAGTSEINDRRVLIISCPQDELTEARVRRALQRVRPTCYNLTVLPPRAGADERMAEGDATLPPKPARYRLIDEADIIVALISGDIVESAEDYEELHVAILRQRTCRGSRVLYPVLAHDLPPDCPLFLSLLPYVSCASDDWWSWRRTPIHALRTSTFALAATSGIDDDSDVYQATESCAEFCRTVIELDLRKRTPSSTPGCFGDVLLNIASVQSWLSSEEASDDAAIDKTSGSGGPSGGGIAAPAALGVDSPANRPLPAAQQAGSDAVTKSGDGLPPEDHMTADTRAQRTSPACTLF